MFMSCEQKAGQCHDVKTGNIKELKYFGTTLKIKIACLEELNAKLTQEMPTAFRYSVLGLPLFCLKILILKYIQL